MVTVPLTRSRNTSKALRARLGVERLEDRSLPSGFGTPHHVVVHAGESIQAAIDHAAPGTEIDVDPGTYSEALTVGKADISLVGRHGPHGGDVALANPGGGHDGIRVTAAGHGFELRNFDVRGFEENGVTLIGVDEFVISHVTAENDGEYGFFPVHSSHGVIEYCTASGHRDTGIYVGQSTDVFVTHSRAFGNVAGFAIENSSHIRVVGNESYNNTGGIFVQLLPGLPVKTASDILVARNFVHDNNHANFAAPGDFIAALPPGIGILVLGVDHVTIAANFVTRNDSLGIGVGSSLLFGLFTDLPPAAFADIEPNADGVRVVGNWVKENGHATAIPFFPGADLLWDGSGTDNVWSGNIFLTSFPRSLPGRHDGR